MSSVIQKPPFGYTDDILITQKLFSKILNYNVNVNIINEIFEVLEDYYFYDLISREDLIIDILREIENIFSCKEQYLQALKVFRPNKIRPSLNTELFIFPNTDNILLLVKHKYNYKFLRYTYDLRSEKILVEVLWCHDKKIECLKSFLID